MNGKGRVVTAALWAAVLVLLAASARANCLPTGAPFTLTSQPGDVAQSNASFGRAVVLSDISGSMRGFSNHTSEYSTIYQTLPEVLQSMGATSVSYYRVGASVETLPQRYFYLAPSAIFYCPPHFVYSSKLEPAERDYFRSVCQDAQGRPSGFNLESRIDLALAQVAREHSAGDLGLAVVITDLFVTGRELEVGYGAAFSAEMAALLRAGVAIGVIGVEAAFDDTMFDLPGYPNASNNGPRHTGTRPFFMLVFGSPDQVAAFGDAISTLVKHRHGMSLFRQYGGTLDLSGRLTALTDVQPEGQLDRSLLDRFRKVDDDLRRIGEAGRFPRMTLPQPNSPRWPVGGVTARIDLPAALGAPDAPPGRLEVVNEETFAYSPGQATAGCDGRWVPVWNNREFPLTSVGPGNLVGIFQNKDVAVRFQQVTYGVGPIFLHRAHLRWVPNSVRAWSRPILPDWVQEFGFTEDDEDAVLERLRYPPRSLAQRSQKLPLPMHTQGFFPALNLPEVVGRLDQVERATLRPIDLGYFVVAWRFQE
jgi:hypothetical protein